MVAHVNGNDRRATTVLHAGDCPVLAASLGGGLSAADAMSFHPARVSCRVEAKNELCEFHHNAGHQAAWPTRLNCLSGAN